MDFSDDPLRLQYQGFLQTPPLWLETADFGLQQFFINPEDHFLKFPLEELSIPDNMVLGRRVEYFLAHYLHKFTSEQILAGNLVVNTPNKTLGELDFLLDNRKLGQRTHLELVYKFYLYDGTFEQEIDRWIGPNRRDSLAAKLNRLRNHQLPLLHHVQTEALLNEMNTNSEEFNQKVCFKANLFVPLEETGRSYPLINKDCIQGYWIKKSQFSEQDYGDCKFHTPSKWNWPIDPSTCLSWCSFDQIYTEILHFHKMKKSPLVWMRTTQMEFIRFFVVWW